MSRLRQLLSVALVALVVSACAPGQLQQLATGGNAFSTFLAGLTQEQMDGSYLKWWRESDRSAYPLEGFPEPIDARCRLRFASSFYEAQRSKPPGVTISETQNLYASEVQGNDGFYSTKRVEMLIILEGQRLENRSSSTSGYNCRYDSPVYIPVRVNMRTGDYLLEGWVNPAATVQVDVRTLKSANLLADTGGQYDRNQDGPLYSPLRINRFTVTDTNLDRILAFARIYNYSDQNSDMGSRRIHWFRTSDIAPYFAKRGGSSGCPAAGFAYAFWEKFDDFSGTGCRLSGDNSAIGGYSKEQATLIKSDLFIDRMARMGKASEIEPARTVESWSEDDRVCNVGVGSSGCNVVDNAAWDRVRKILAKLLASATATSSGGSSSSASIRAKAWTDLQNEFKASPGVLIDGISAPDSRMLDAEGKLQPDVVGIIAGHGQKAWEDLDQTLNDAPPLKRFGSFVGKGDPYDSGSVLVSPSFEITSVGGAGGTEEQRAWLEAHSALFGADATTASFMAFRTALSDGDTKGGLPFVQGTLARLTLSVGGATINSSSRSVYTTDYIPLSVIGRLADRVSAGVNTSYEPWNPAGWVQTINNFIVNIYKGTLGAAMSGLSSFAVSGLASLPTLTRFELDGTASDARAASGAQVKHVYRLSDRVDRDVFTGDGGNLDSLIKGLDVGKQACTYAAWQGLLNPATVDHAENDYYFEYTDSDGVTGRYAFADCYVSSTTYLLFQISRAISLILFMVFIALFFFRLGTGRAKDMTITGFAARAAISLSIIFGMPFIIAVASAIVAEVITLTNYFGTVLSGGKPYSYLWLFGAYLSNPDINAFNVFSLFLLTPFSLVGLLVLSIVNFLRSIVTMGMIALAPVWVISLMYKTESRFFERSLLLLLRVYLIPLLTLITLMILFLFFPLSTDITTSNSEFGVIGAVLGLIAMLLAVIIPFFFANLLVKRYGERVVGAVRGALDAARNSGRADLLEAGMRGAAAGDYKTFDSDTARAAMKEFRDGLTPTKRELGAGGSDPGGALGPGGANGGATPRLKRLSGGQLGDGSDGGGGEGSLALPAGGAKGEIAAERERQRGAFARLKGLKQRASERYLAAGGGKAGATSLLRHALTDGTKKGLGASASLVKWSARYATNQMIGEEITATQGYKRAKIAEARAKLIGVGQSIGAVNADGTPNLASTSGRLYATGLELAAGVRDEAKGYAREKLNIARGAFTSGVDAQRQYLDAETRVSDLRRTLDTSRDERDALNAAIAAGSYGAERSPERKRALDNLAALDAQIVAAEQGIEGAEAAKKTAAALFAAASQSTTGSLGNRIYALRDSAVGNEIFGSSEAARARNEADANAAAAEAVVRRTNEEIAALDVERRRLEMAGDQSGARRVASMISSKASLRDEVLVEQEGYRNDSARRHAGAEERIEEAVSDATRAAMAAMGRAGAVKARQALNESNERIEAVDRRIAEVDAADRQHRAAVDAGTISGPSPYVDEMRQLNEQRAAEQARAAAAERVIAEMRDARRIAQTWQRAANGQLPDGTPVEVGFGGSFERFVSTTAAAAGVISGSGVSPFTTTSTSRDPDAAQAAAISRQLDEKLSRLGIPTTPVASSTGGGATRRSSGGESESVRSESVATPPTPPPPPPSSPTSRSTSTDRSQSGASSTASTPTSGSTPRESTATSSRREPRASERRAVDTPTTGSSSTGSATTERPQEQGPVRGGDRPSSSTTREASGEQPVQREATTRRRTPDGTSARAGGSESAPRHASESSESAERARQRQDDSRRMAPSARSTTSTGGGGDSGTTPPIIPPLRVARVRPDTPVSSEETTPVEMASPGGGEAQPTPSPAATAPAAPSVAADQGGDGYIAPDWESLIERGSAAELAAAVERGIAALDPVATGIGGDGIALLAAAESAGRGDHPEIRGLLRLFLR